MKPVLKDKMTLYRSRQFMIPGMLCLLVMACTSDHQPAEPVKPSVAAPSKSQPSNVPPSPYRQPAPSRAQPIETTPPAPTTGVLMPQANPTATEGQASKISTPQPDTSECDPAIELSEEHAIFLPDNKVFVTRIMSPCLTALGQRGHKKNSGWMAMGFPCTGGEGRIDWKGTNYTRPKMVSFLMETSCPMSPDDTKKIQREAMKLAKVSESAPLIAFNPFVLQYWEVQGFEDADTSFEIDLRSSESLGDGWSRFLKGMPLKVSMVGRENAWVPGNKLYVVDGEIIHTKKNRFRFKVTNASLLTGDALQTIKKRCEALRPERSCSEVFKP